MSSDIVFQIIVLILLVCLSAFFSSAETAFVTVNQIRIQTLAKAGNKRAKTVLNILKKQDKMLSCILIGNNIVNLSASSLATTLAIQLFGSRSVGYVTGALTLIILIFGEITPKNAATVSSEKLSLLYAPAIDALMTLLTPVSFIITHLAAGVMALLHIDRTGGDASITEDEIRTMVDVSHKEGETTGAERDMINNVYDFGDQTASDIMVPRADMVEVSCDDSYEEIERVFRTEHFTRLPVYEDDRDHIVGILNIKDFCFVEDPAQFKAKDLMYAPYFTYETKRLADLMVEMRENSSTLTIVLDEYGSAVGMLTFEDLIEELVGEIRDEYDSDEVNLIKKVSDRSYLIVGGMKLDDINDQIGTDLDSEEYDSIGGYVIEHLEHLPSVGEKVVTDSGLTIQVERMVRTRIAKVRLTLPKKDNTNRED